MNLTINKTISTIEDAEAFFPALNRFVYGVLTDTAPHCPIHQTPMTVHGKGLIDAQYICRPCLDAIANRRAERARERERIRLQNEIRAELEQQAKPKRRRPTRT